MPAGLLRYPKNSFKLLKFRIALLRIIKFDRKSLGHVRQSFLGGHFKYLNLRLRANVNSSTLEKFWRYLFLTVMVTNTIFSSRKQDKYLRYKWNYKAEVEIRFSFRRCNWISRYFNYNFDNLKQLLLAIVYANSGIVISEYKTISSYLFDLPSTNF